MTYPDPPCPPLTSPQPPPDFLQSVGVPVVEVGPAVPELPGGAQTAGQGLQAAGDLLEDSLTLPDGEGPGPDEVIRQEVIHQRHKTLQLCRGEVWGPLDGSGLWGVCQKTRGITGRSSCIYI